MKTCSWIVALPAIAGLYSTLAGAQAYPAKPIRVVVPFAAGSGLDNTVRLMGDRFQKMTGQPLVLDNKGGREAIKDFLGGHVQSIFGSPLQMMPHVPTGRAKILAITKARRAEVLPNTPTFLELGFPNMVVDIWTAYIAPAGTPDAIVQKLYTEFARILAMPDVVKAMEAEGQTIVASSPAEMGQMIRTELKRWDGVVKASGWKVQ